MKKTLSVILIALIAMTGLFAASGASGTSISTDSASTTLTLNIDADALESYKFGFTDSDPGDMTSSTPGALDNIELTYTRGGLTQAKVGYVYYYIKAASLPTITLTAGEGFTSSDEGYDTDTIKYTLTTLTDGNSVSGSSAKGVSLGLNNLTDGIAQGAVQFGIIISEAGNVDADFSAASWTDTITVDISAT